MSYDYAQMDRDLDRAKAKLFLSNNAAFLGPLMCSLDFHWSTSIEQTSGTAATDGIRLWWHPDDFLACTTEGRVSTIMHELKHVYRMHNIRRNTRCPDVWNMACDIAINRELRQESYLIDDPHWPGGAIQDHREIPHDLEEEIYDFLNKPGGGGASGGSQPGHTCGGMMPLNQADKQQLLNNIVKAVHTAQMSNQAGSVPGEVELLLDQFLKPKIPWSQALFRWFNDMMDENFSWKRPNRRYSHMYLPSRITEDGRLEELSFYWDTSGSIGDEDLLRFNSEVAYIKNTFDPVKLNLIQFDTRITKEQTFGEQDRFEMVKALGRGGTDLEPVRKHIAKTKPTAAVIFSDLYCDPMGDTGVECPVLWICVNQPSATVPFGEIIHIK